MTKRISKLQGALAMLVSALVLGGCDYNFAGYFSPVPRDQAPQTPTPAGAPLTATDGGTTAVGVSDPTSGGTSSAGPGTSGTDSGSGSGSGTSGMGSGTSGSGSGSPTPSPSPSPVTVANICLSDIQGGLIALNRSSSISLSGTHNLVTHAFLFNDSSFSIAGNTIFNGTVWYSDSSSQITWGTGKSTQVSQLMTASELGLYWQIANQLIPALEAEEENLPLDPANPTSMATSINTSSVVRYVDQADNANLNVMSAEGDYSVGGVELDFNHNPNALFVLRITGNVSFGSGGIKAINTPTSTLATWASHVIVYFPNSGHPGYSSSSISFSGSAGAPLGTLLAPDRALSFGGNGQFAGALASGASITISGNSSGSTADFTAAAFCGGQ